MGSTNKTPEQAHLEDLVATQLPESPIYRFLLTPVQVKSASKGHFTARLPLTENHMNRNGSLHGSVTATIVDWAGGMAITSFDLRRKTGVSIDIHVTYQSGVKLGDELEIEGVAEKVGNSMAFTRIAIYKVEDGERGRLVATGTHTKYVKGLRRKRINETHNSILPRDCTCAHRAVCWLESKTNPVFFASSMVPCMLNDWTHSDGNSKVSF